MPAKGTWDYTHEKRRLDSGLTRVLVMQPHLHYGTISIHIGAGSRYERGPDNGLAHFVEHMVFRGTRRFETSYDLNLAVERLGGTLNASTTADSTEYTLALPSANIERGVDLLSELVVRPRFDDLEIERKVILEEIREDLGEDGSPVDIDFLSRRRLWPANPLGQSITGPVENALRFTIDDLRRAFDDAYLASNAIVCVSGGFDRDGVARAVDRSFGDMRRGEASRTWPEVSPGRGATAFHAHKPGSQTQLRVAFHAPGLFDADSTAADILLRLLDDGMSTPLHRRVFETKGLAYNVGADLEAYTDVGALNVDATCSHENVIPVLDEVLSIAADLRDRPIPEADLDKARSRAVWGLEDYQDSPDAMNGWYGEQELFREAPAIEAEAEACEAITEADVRRAAGKIFKKGAFHVTTVGVLDDRQRAAIERKVEELD